ncbi:hypothetical protein FB567DRAFT_127260 [Paraphoma chrysanthemicola]|uniref:T6SS Phospholipase effector Tle1-like catalytic domain-containing protein n=1 Tax=Paraphoma chrysanthemicola TaxID=798071 RepID=A0A8K0VV09_9PLEO|nr:hypothetical protein FB567DRAFT_127260 [Paraphoma chrysanthemicola]
MAAVVEAAPKRIILCCDGTWQSSVTGKHNLPSNITRLARTIAKAGRDEHGKVWQQIAYYDAGVGSGSLSKLEADRQGATGDGLVTNMLEAYNFVVNNYSPGDKIYCFGFSRGAFTARAIAGMITDLGVMKPDNMRFFPSLWDAYQKNTSKYNFRKTKEYFEWKMGKAPLVPESQKETSKVKIPWYEMGAGNGMEYENSRSVELVGVFDTVGSLGIAETYLHTHASTRQVFEWINVKWNPYIKHAFHALALDDRRQSFLPTLYYIPYDDVVAAENKILAKDEVDWPELTEHRKQVDAELEQQKADHKPDLVQVWFTGVHINVGGGTDDAKTDFEGLANITFAWMVEQCRPYLAFEPFTNATIARYLQRMVEDDTEQSLRKKEAPPTTLIGKAVAAITEDLGAIGSFFSGDENATPKEKMVRTYCFEPSVVPPYRPEHWTLFHALDSYSLFYKAFSSPEMRTPGHCDDRSTEDHIPLQKLGQTNEWIHPSVKWRLDKSKAYDEDEFHYRSKPLESFDWTQKDGVYGWKHKWYRNVWIPEWPIAAALQDEDPCTTSENAEMALINACLDKDGVRKYLRDHTIAFHKVHPPAKGT